MSWLLSFSPQPHHLAINGGTLIYDKSSERLDASLAKIGILAVERHHPSRRPEPLNAVEREELLRSVVDRVASKKVHVDVELDGSS